MKTEIFPAEFKQQLENEFNKESVNAFNSMQYNCAIHRPKFPWHLPDLPIGIPMVIGFITGFFSCLAVQPREIWIIVSAGAVFVFSFLIGVGYCELADRSRHKAHKKFMEIKETFEKNEEVKYEQRIEALCHENQKRLEEYTSAFLKNAKEMSARFSESQAGQEIAAWLTDGFSRTIRTADRSVHVEKIQVPFTFNVYTDKITSNIGTYNFEKHRYSNLTTPLEQTALAVAIATAIEVNIRTAFPQDVSGTDITFDITYAYTETYLAVQMTYTAANGKYEAVRNW